MIPLAAVGLALAPVVARAQAQGGAQGLVSAHAAAVTRQDETTVRSPDGRTRFSISPDGLLGKHDAGSGEPLAQARTVFSPTRLAISGDGLWLLVVGVQPATLALFDADLRQWRTHVGATRDGRRASAVESVITAARRRSFVVTFTDMAELWELSYDPQAEPIFDGLVHDYRMGEAIARPGFLGVRRTLLEAPLAIVELDGPQRHVAGTWVRAGQGEQATPLQVINLDIRRRIPGALWPLPPRP